MVTGVPERSHSFPGSTRMMLNQKGWNNLVHFKMNILKYLFKVFFLGEKESGACERAEKGVAGGRNKSPFGCLEQFRSGPI